MFDLKEASDKNGYIIRKNIDVKTKEDIEMREVYRRGEKDHRTAGLQIRQYGHHGEAARSRRNRNIGSSLGVFIALTAVFILGGVIFSGVLASAHEEPENKTVGSTCYKSIEIEQGDTLWELAEKYMTDDYLSVQEYVQDLKRMNHLTDDTIISGQHLIVAYQLAG